MSARTSTTSAGPTSSASAATATPVIPAVLPAEQRAAARRSARSLHRRGSAGERERGRSEIQTSSPALFRDFPQLATTSANANNSQVLASAKTTSTTGPPAPPPLRPDGPGAGVHADGLERLVRAAERIADAAGLPASPPPPPPPSRGALEKDASSYGDTLEWVVARLDALGDYLETCTNAPQQTPAHSVVEVHHHHHHHHESAAALPGSHNHQMPLLTSTATTSSQQAGSTNPRPSSTSGSAQSPFLHTHVHSHVHSATQDASPTPEERRQMHAVAGVQAITESEFRVSQLTSRQSSSHAPQLRQILQQQQQQHDQQTHKQTYTAPTAEALAALDAQTSRLSALEVYSNAVDVHDTEFTSSPVDVFADGEDDIVEGPAPVHAHGPPRLRLPGVPSGIDLDLNSVKSKDNVAAAPPSSSQLDDVDIPILRLPSDASTFRSRKSISGNDKERLHADYDKIYNRAEGEQFEDDESPIEVAGGDLYRARPISERWDLGEQIGVGGFSTVRRASSKMVRRPSRLTIDSTVADVAAVKLIPKRAEQYNQRMVCREVFSYRLLEMAGGHENIVKLYEVCEDSKYVYLVMELLEGGELFSRISERGQYTEKDAASLVVSMLASLMFCHRFNLTHRDVKPENFVFLESSATGNEPEIKLTDFGIAHYTEDPDAVCRTMCGTPLYVAPEVLLRQPYGAEADLWSLGVIVYIMLVGYPPFHDNDIVQLVRKIKYRPVSFDGPEWALISEEGKEFIANLLDKDASNRMTAQQAIEHDWLKNNCSAATKNVLEVAQSNIKSFVTKSRWKVGIPGMKALPKFGNNKTPTEFTTATTDNSDDSKEIFDSYPSDPPSYRGRWRKGQGSGDLPRGTMSYHADTLDGTEPNSFWGRKRFERIPRRPPSRNRHSHSYRKSDGLPIGSAGDITPRTSDDSAAKSIRAERERRVEPNSNSAVTSPSPEPVSSSISSTDHGPVAPGVGSHHGGNFHSPPSSARARRGPVWKARKMRTASNYSEPGGTRHDSQDAFVMEQSQRKREGSRFRFFR